MMNKSNSFQISAKDSQVLSALHPKSSENQINVAEYIQGQSTTILQPQAGLYSFWWTGSPKELQSLNRKVLFKGKKVKGVKGQHFNYHYEWPENKAPQCLYIGKTTDLEGRLKMHLLNTKKYLDNDWYGDYSEYGKGADNPTLKRALQALEVNKESPEFKLLVKHTTACQFRAGLEHLYQGQQRELNGRDRLISLTENISFCFSTKNVDYTDHESQELDGANMAGRFYLEDLAIGLFKPWFNLDSER